MMLPGETAVLDAVQMPGRYQVRVDRSRDALLTDFGRATLTDRYLMPGEKFRTCLPEWRRNTAITTPIPSGCTTI